MNLKNKDGFLSAYGLSCGYTETRESDTISLNLFKQHGVYHVQFNRFDLPYSLRGDCKNWYSYQTLAEAKKHFVKLCRTFNFKIIN